MKSAFILFTLFCILLDEPTAHLVKGKNYLQSKEYIEALNEFTTAVSINPNYAEAYYYRALAKDMMGKEGGFIVQDICVDLILAVENGYTSALPMLRDKSDQFCFNLKAASAASPDAIYCADFSSSVLSEMPKFFFDMILLTNLKLFNNRFEAFPDLTSSKYLVHLDLGSNSIASIPEHVFKLQWLSHLNLTRNKISSVSASISNLKYLNELIVRENYLEQLPIAFAQLKTLETLDMSFNRFKTIPECLEQMTGLKTLVLTGNPLTEGQVNELKRKLKSTRIYF